ncbi:hypothetical protein [Fluviicola sp.]|uniref:hypothetical protein n=1 Tax=Fluviicola sp. TaxID=1917219 RepID=UPI003D2BF717
MKHLLILALLLPLAILTSCNSNRNNSEVEQSTLNAIEEYKNVDFHYRVVVKSSWTNEVIEGDGFYNIRWNLPSIESAYSKKLVSVNFGVEASKNWDSFEDALSSSLEEVKAACYYFKWDEESKSCVFQYGDPKRQLKGKCYYIFKNKIGYRLTFSANKDTYNHFISEFERFCKTFKTID